MVKLTITLPHDAHAGWEGGFTVASCRDCDWVERFNVADPRFPNALAAWNEATRARDVHHDTHKKEIA